MSWALEVVPIETDVLVIGGGLAGCMAAIKAAEQGVEVAIAEKANTENSGCAATGIDHTWAYIPPVHEAMGYTIDDMMEDHRQAIAGGLMLKDLFYLVAGENYERVLEMERFGVNFRFEDSPVPGKFRVVQQFHTVPSSFNFDGRLVKLKMSQEARKRSVKIHNRVAITDLVVASGRVAGATGIGVRDGRLYDFRAKSVVLSTGRSGRFSGTGSGVWGGRRLPPNNTGEGKAMALRAGVPVINMEFLGPSTFVVGNYEQATSCLSNTSTTKPAGRVLDMSGEILVDRTHFFDWDTLGERIDHAATRAAWVAKRRARAVRYGELIKQGKGPFFYDLTAATEEELSYILWSVANEGHGSMALEHLRQEGVDLRFDMLEALPGSRELSGNAAAGLLVGKDLETNVEGLFAAGDEVGGLPWAAASGAIAMGGHAGVCAGRRAAREGFLPPASRETLDALKQQCSGMTNRDHGRHWTEVELAAHNAVDYYAGPTRARLMLERGLDRLRYVRDNAELKAANPHELGRCFEVLSIIDNSEMVMRASLERKETRRFPAGFVRADHPEEDNENWLCFLSQRMEGRQVVFSKVPALWSSE